jgi:hypothetical protein
MFRACFPFPVELVDPQAAPAPSPAPVVQPATAPSTAPARPVADRPVAPFGARVNPVPAGMLRTIFNPKNGKSLQSPFSLDDDAYAALKAKLAAGGIKDDTFAKSLISKYGTRKFSPAMNYWMHLLALPSRPKAEGEQIDMTGLRSMFDHAAAKLKRPAILLTVGQGPKRTQVKVSLCGKQSKTPGAIAVAGPHYGGAYYGKVVGNMFEPGRNDTPLVRDLLRRLSLEPEKVAAEQGKLTGKCCFCNRALDDERSTAVGYGPNCAEKFHLNWGSKVRAA